MLSKRFPFTYNPEAERRGHLLKCYKPFIIESYSGISTMRVEEKKRLLNIRR